MCGERRLRAYAETIAADVCAGGRVELSESVVSVLGVVPRHKLVENFYASEEPMNGAPLKGHRAQVESSDPNFLEIVYSDQALDEGDVVELNLKLLPQGQKIVTFARVILIREESENNQGRYKISLDCEHIHDTDREVLVKHVHGKQMRELGNARFKSKLIG